MSRIANDDNVSSVKLFSCHLYTLELKPRAIIPFDGYFVNEYSKVVRVRPRLFTSKGSELLLRGSRGPVVIHFSGVRSILINLKQDEVIVSRFSIFADLVQDTEDSTLVIAAQRQVHEDIARVCQCELALEIITAERYFSNQRAKCQWFHDILAVQDVLSHHAPRSFVADEEVASLGSAVTKVYCHFVISLIDLHCLLPVLDINSLE
jgi:hypothetical protein